MERRSVKPHGEEERLVRHIGFAERWLTRARQEVTRGEVARGVLTLLLAEAEVQHAREETLGPRAALPRPAAATLAVLGAAALAAVFLAGRALLLPPADVIDGFSSGPVIVRFKQPGSTLALVPAVLAPESLPAVTTPRPRADRVWRNTARPVVTRPAPRGLPAPAAAPPAPPAPTLVTEGDLIDIAIAAERSLRGEKR